MIDMYHTVPHHHKYNHSMDYMVDQTFSKCSMHTEDDSVYDDLGGHFAQQRAAGSTSGKMQFPPVEKRSLWQDEDCVVQHANSLHSDYSMELRYASGSCARVDEWRGQCSNSPDSSQFYAQPSFDRNGGAASHLMRQDPDILNQYLMELRATRAQYLEPVRKVKQLREMAGAKPAEVRQFNTMLEQLTRDRAYFTLTGKIITWREIQQLRTFTRKVEHYFEQPHIQERLRLYDQVYVPRGNTSHAKPEGYQSNWVRDAHPNQLMSNSRVKSNISREWATCAYDGDTQYDRSSSPGTASPSTSAVTGEGLLGTPTQRESRPLHDAQQCVSRMDPDSFHRNVSALRMLGQQLTSEIAEINAVLAPLGVRCTLHDKTNSSLDHLVVKCNVVRPEPSYSTWDSDMAAWADEPEGAGPLDKLSDEEWKHLSSCALDVYVHVNYPRYVPRAAWDEPKHTVEYCPIKQAIKEALKVNMANIPKPVYVQHIAEAFYTAVALVVSQNASR